MDMSERLSSLGSASPQRGWRRLLDLDRWPSALFWYGLLAGVACFWRLGSTGVISMEGMLVDGARHMLESGDWLVPRVYGEIYTYKPALAYWLAAIPLQISAQPPEWLLRLPFAATGFLLGVAVLILVGRIAGSRIGLFCSLASLMGGLTLQKLKLAEFDIVLAAGVGVAVAAACHNLAVRRPSSSVWLLGYLGLAVGFLAKGPVAVMVYGPGALAAAVATRRLRRLVRWQHLSAALAFVLAVAGYLWAGCISTGPTFFEQPQLEAKVRGLGWIYGESDAASAELAAFRESAPEAEITGRPMLAVARTLIKPVFIWVAFLPWSVLLPVAFRRRPDVASDDAVSLLVRSARGFLIAAALAFMITSTHEMRYYLPLGVPMGILCGLAAEGTAELGRRWRRGLLVASVAVAAISALAAALGGIAGKHASLYFYLERTVLAFRAGHSVPPAGSYCLLPSDRLAEFEEPSPLEFVEIVRVEHPRGDFLLGSCSWIAGGDVSP